MTYQYSLDFGVFNALEAGIIPTGHVQVELLRTDTATGVVESVGLYEAMPTSAGSLRTYLNPVDGTIDGYMGAANSRYSGGIHTTVALTDEEASRAIEFIATHTGPNNQIAVNYNIFGINGSSCYSFAQEFYSYVTGSQTTFLARFTETELRSLSSGDPSWIIRWYGGVGPNTVHDELDNLIAPCFSASTPILLADGTSVAIEDIHAGMRVAAFDERDAGGTGALTSGVVTRLIPGITTEWIVLDDASSARLRQDTRVTPNHRYLTEHGTWMTAGDLIASDVRAVAADGSFVSLTGTLLRATDADSDATWITPEPELRGNTLLQPAPVLGWRTYNFEVADLHTYVAANDNAGTFQMLVAQAGGV